MDYIYTASCFSVRFPCNPIEADIISHHGGTGNSHTGKHNRYDVCLRGELPAPWPPDRPPGSPVHHNASSAVIICDEDVPVSV